MVLDQLTSQKPADLNSGSWIKITKLLMCFNFSQFQIKRRYFSQLHWPQSKICSKIPEMNHFTKFTDILSLCIFMDPKFIFPFGNIVSLFLMLGIK